MLHRFLKTSAPPRTTYLLCAEPRSGSNYLCDGLIATQKAGNPRQYFLPKFQPDYARRYGIADEAGPRGYARQILDLTASANNVAGFKVMSWYLNDFVARLRGEPDVASARSDVQFLREIFPNLRFIRLVRRDKLRQAISIARAKQTGLWKVRPEREARRPETFDRDLIEDCLREAHGLAEVSANFFARLGLEPLQIEYETLCSDYISTLENVFAFLEVSARRADLREPDTVRQADRLTVEWEEKFRALHPGPARPEVISYA